MQTHALMGGGAERQGAGQLLAAVHTVHVLALLLGDFEARLSAAATPLQQQHQQARWPIQPPDAPALSISLALSASWQQGP